MESSNEAGQIKNVSGNTTQMVHSKAHIQSVPIVLRIKQNQPTPSKENEFKTTLQMGQTNHSVLQTSQTNHPVLLGQSNKPSLQIKVVKQPSVQTRLINQPVLQVGQANHSVLQTRQTNQPELLGQSNKPFLQIKVVKQPSVQTRLINQPVLQMGQTNHSVLQTRQTNHPVLLTQSNQPSLQIKPVKQQSVQTRPINQPVLQVGRANRSVLQTSEMINQPVLQVRQTNQPILQTTQMINQPVLQVGQTNHSILQTTQTINQPLLQVGQKNPSVLQTTQTINQPALQVGHGNLSVLQTSQTNYPVLQKQSNQPSLQIKQPAVQIRQVNYPAQQVGQVNQQALKVGKIKQRTLLMSQCKQETLQALKFAQGKKRALQMKQCKQGLEVKLINKQAFLQLIQRYKQTQQFRQVKQALKISKDNKSAQHIGQVNQCALHTGHIIQPTLSMKNHRQLNQPPLQMGHVNQRTLPIGHLNQSSQQMTGENQSAHENGQVNRQSLQIRDANELAMQMRSENQPVQQIRLFNQLSSNFQTFDTKNSLNKLQNDSIISESKSESNKTLVQSRNMCFLNKDIKTEPVENVTGFDSFTTIVKSEPQETASTNQNPIPQCVVVTYCKDTVVQPNAENDTQMEFSEIPNQEHMEITDTPGDFNGKNKVKTAPMNMTENVEFTSIIETIDEVKMENVENTNVTENIGEVKTENVTFTSVTENIDEVKTENVTFTNVKENIDEVKTENVMFTSIIESNGEVNTESVNVTCLHSSALDSQVKTEDVYFTSIIKNSDKLETDNTEFTFAHTVQEKTEDMETTEKQLYRSGIQPCDFDICSQSQNENDSNVARIQLETNNYEINGNEIGNKNMSWDEGNKVQSAYEFQRHLEPGCAQPLISDLNEEKDKNIESMDVPTTSQRNTAYISNASEKSKQDTILMDKQTSCVQESSGYTSKVSEKSKQDSSIVNEHSSCVQENSAYTAKQASTASQSQQKHVSTTKSDRKSPVPHSNVAFKAQPFVKTNVAGKIYSETEKKGIQYYTALGKSLLKSIQAGKKDSSIDQNVLLNYSLSGSFLFKGQGGDRPVKITILDPKLNLKKTNQSVGLESKATPGNIPISLHSKFSHVNTSQPKLQSVTSESPMLVTSASHQTMSPQKLTKDIPVPTGCGRIHEQKMTIVEQNPPVRHLIRKNIKPQSEISNINHLDINNQSKLNKQALDRQDNRVSSTSNLSIRRYRSKRHKITKTKPQRLTTAVQSIPNSEIQSLSNVNMEAKSQQSTSKKDFDLYACDLCNISFKKRAGLEKHVSIFHDIVVPSEMSSVKFFQCGICNNDRFKFSSDTMLNEHMISFHCRYYRKALEYNSRRIQEQKSSKTNLDKEQIEKEHLKDIMEKQLKPMTKSSDTMLTEHNHNRKAEEHNKKAARRKQEQKCSKKTLDKEQIQKKCFKENMEKQLKPMTNNQFTCHSCLSTFTTKSSFRIHLRWHSQNDKRTLLCHICGKYSISPQCSCLKQCGQCYKVFDNLQDLRNHRAANHKKTKRSLVCKMCTLTFSNHSTLQKHIQKHLGFTKVLCYICGKFLTPGHIAQHKAKMKIRFKCSFCGKGFNRKAHYDEHLSMHKGKLSFNCDMCGRRLGRFRNLVRHIKHHIGESLYNCEVCGKKFVLFCRLMCHMRTISHQAQMTKKYL